HLVISVLRLHPSPRAVREEVGVGLDEPPEELVELRLLHVAVARGVEQVEALEQPHGPLDGVDAAPDLLGQILTANDARGPKDEDQSGEVIPLLLVVGEPLLLPLL